jgi:hypothetical protein
LGKVLSNILILEDGVFSTFEGTISITKGHARFKQNIVRHKENLILE